MGKKKNDFLFYSINVLRYNKTLEVIVKRMKKGNLAKKICGIYFYLVECVGNIYCFACFGFKHLKEEFVGIAYANYLLGINFQKKTEVTFRTTY